MIETLIRCSWCGAEATVRGPSHWPSGPRGWAVDLQNFYLPHGRHKCPRHAHIGSATQTAVFQD